LRTSCGRTDRRAPCLRGLIAVALTALVALAAWPAAGATAAQPQAGGPTAGAAAAQKGFGRAVLAELNRVRAKHGLGPVAADRRMGRVAARHSRDMARRNYFAHGSWGGRVARAAGSPRAVGEVIGWLKRASPRAEARGVVRGWLDSPAHRHVLLDGGFERVGIGRAPGRVGSIGAALYTVDWASAR
jgi:uncharacterized protein YkwD